MDKISWTDRVKVLRLHDVEREILLSSLFKTKPLSIFNARLANSVTPADWQFYVSFHGLCSVVLGFHCGLWQRMCVLICAKWMPCVCISAFISCPIMVQHSQGRSPVITLVLFDQHASFPFSVSNCTSWTNCVSRRAKCSLNEACTDVKVAASVV